MWFSFFILKTTPLVEFANCLLRVTQLQIMQPKTPSFSVLIPAVLNHTKSFKKNTVSLFHYSWMQSEPPLQLLEF